MCVLYLMKPVRRLGKRLSKQKPREVKGCGRRSGPRDGPPKMPPTLLPSFPTRSRVVTLPQGAAAWVRASDWLAKVTGSHPSCQGCGLFWGRGGSPPPRLIIQTIRIQKNVCSYLE